MRITGRTVRPSNLAERRLLLSVGVTCVRVARSQNPYAVARRIARLARGGDAADLLRLVTADRPLRPLPFPLPTPDLDGPPRWPIHA